MSWVEARFRDRSKSTWMDAGWLPAGIAALLFGHVFLGGVHLDSAIDWHLMAELGSITLALMIVAFAWMYYKAGGEAPAVLLGLSYLVPTLVAVFLMIILPVVVMGNFDDFGIFAGATGALAFSMLMTIGSAFARRPPRPDLGSFIGLMVAVTLLSASGAAGIMDLLVGTYSGSRELHLDASIMASAVAGTGFAAAAFMCWRAGGRLNARMCTSLAVAATGHLAMLLKGASPTMIGFAHAARVIAQMGLLLAVFREGGDLLEEQKRLSRQYQMYRWALNSVPIGVISTDLAGVIQTVNRMLSDIVQIPDDRISGLNIREFMARAGMVHENGSSSSSPLELTGEIMVERGSSRVVLSARSLPVTVGEGVPAGHVHIMRDVTEERRLEADLRRSERLAIAGSLARVVSSRLAGPVRQMKRELDGSLGLVHGEAKGFLSLSLHEVERLESLMRDLRFLQGPGSPNRRVVSLGEIAQRVLEIDRTSISRKRVTTSLKMAPGDEVIADRHRIQQVITNIIRNAIDAVDPGGTIGVQTWVDAERHRVFMEVRNTGNPIADQDLERVFEPFFSTKASGTGLGLSVCRRIVEDHGGRIRIANEESGVSCSIELPACSRIDGARGDEGLLVGDILEGDDCSQETNSAE